MKKDDIVNAARNLFTDYGYKKVSMEEIASKAGVTKKTIYNYFHDKEELFEYFIKEELEKMAEVFEENLKENKSFSERITKGLKEILILWLKHSCMYLQSPCRDERRERPIQVPLLFYVFKSVIRYKLFCVC